MNAQDTKYAEGASREAFQHAAFLVEHICDENRELIAYRKSQIVKAAKWLEAGLTRIAAQ